MPVGSLDATRRIPQRLSALGVSQNFFARCIGLTSGEASQLFSSKKPLGGTRAKSMLAMVADLEMLQRTFAPAPIKFSDHEEILGIIQQLKSGELMIGKMRHGMVEIHTQDFDWGF